MHAMEPAMDTSPEERRDSAPQTQREEEDTNRGQLARREVHPESGLVQRQPTDMQHRDGEQTQAVAQTHHESDRGGAPAVRLDMDLDVDVELKAKIKGDVTLAILEGDQNQSQGGNTS